MPLSETSDTHSSAPYPAAGDVALERDPFIIGLKQRLPEDLRESFSEKQLQGLRSAFATRSWGRHQLDWRGTFGLWSNQYYFVLVGGRNKRNLSRSQRNISLAAKAAAITLFLFFCVLVGLLALYLIKSALGINLLPNFSLGIWDWFKGGR
ncbi:3-phosphoshikimate 1-carboxyvinyltransferase [Stutzerimonas zhaodongensis]|uniref:3-phosphoshikimate 1-carboxyvinyltransferase n=1 Tax=Stutzerimonas zhaodongensis TaxID=1176257 RepID=A0A3M2HQF9_9GAMM|nr:3-phosphoshikimate 1-carboxyvinyltransferase [Stutzerimonas zhaodongensis]MCQ2028885.1 3-phosphoshikimate 1-carboxyvinyltransferase [Stutzerimonas zhaodongensis]MCQ4317328.1 3-phosphoshikimate 1-carboxyvinyltransferase [Stutzerimonas zhaodongensis]RMH88437.1 3-phosphoshikimate 1-carboxyvinyltransferase [Stutzerimonas zhaodongensis]